ncbi:peroxisomal membrane protein receptor Pex19 [Aspergillus bombycis]|uniref:Peroxisomal membrane protein receptor Pex19 n=1 Tax=Aspergillus bombycis TaxID=109264 RepID=A0A1F7ZQL0_9EURO|nr:peroxisomal membrane protein receptor Pex19 [Aspergillus bombycis]OGM41398.1 peroxisomal membrane protein receptor Pex19 [Aspergillus bombycis]
MSTPSASPVNGGDPQQNESAPVSTSAENVKMATTTATAVPETSAQPADKPQAQPQQPKEAIDDDDDDDDESDLDELDDVLDDFNKPKPAPAPAPIAPSQPATAPEANDFDEEAFMKQLEKDMASMMGHAAKESGAPDDKGFEDTINQGADAFTKQLEESGIPPGDFLKQLLADVMAEEDGGDASAGAAAAPSTGSSGSSSGGAGAGAPPESFNDAIQQTINRMQESGDKATAAASEDDADDMLAHLLKALETTGLDADADDGGIMNVVAAMMEQLSNKEMLYDPMKELDGKFGPWLVENKGKGRFSDEEMERFEKQATLASQIVAKFEEPGYTDEDAKCREYVWGKMQEMQAAGSPPEELVANPFGKDLKGPGGMPMPDCTQQ